MSDIYGGRGVDMSQDEIRQAESKKDALIVLLEQYGEIKRTRLSAIEAQEDALLELATKVLGFKQEFGFSWRELNRAFGFPHADSTLYRLLNRSGEITDRAYGKIASGLNKALEDAGGLPFEARVWVNWKVGL